MWPSLFSAASAAASAASAAAAAVAADDDAAAADAAAAEATLQYLQDDGIRGIRTRDSATAVLPVSYAHPFKTCCERKSMYVFKRKYKKLFLVFLVKPSFLPTPNHSWHFRNGK